MGEERGKKQVGKILQILSIDDGGKSHISKYTYLVNIPFRGKNVVQSTSTFITFSPLANFRMLGLRSIRAEKDAN